MTVAVFVSSESDAASLIPWGVRFACAEHSELLIVCPRKSKGKRGWDPLELSEKDNNSLYRTVFEILEAQDPEKVVLKQAIAAGTESSDLDRTAIEMRELIAPSPEDAFVEEIQKLDVRTLLLPAREQIKGTKGEEQAWAQKLFLQAPCQVVMVRGTPPECEDSMRVLVASHDQTSAHDLLAISQAGRLAKTNENGSVTVLYVRPDDDEVARLVGEKHLRQLERGNTDKAVVFDTRVELAESFTDGINQVDLDQYDLLLVGTLNPKTIRTVLRNTKQSEGEPQIPIAISRVGVPLSDRLWDGFKNFVRSRVPQLDRDHRTTLVERLQENSDFNFDFVALISLSTLIAALGLAQNSGAVVIGAMLVAPLMTPLVGMGFALVQGNGKLIRNALRTVILGFTVALGIGAVLGAFLMLFSPDFVISGQMLARGKPNILDLIIALASGIAGAYAMGRPNLLSALPGVAIAAALVPPIATSGLALTMGNFGLSAGASMLFFTNIVAIVLGTAMTFWAVGVSTRVGSGDRTPQMWPRYWFLGFVVLSFLLAVKMSWKGSETIPKPKVEAKTSNVQALIDVK